MVSPVFSHVSKAVIVGPRFHGLVVRQSEVVYGVSRKVFANSTVNDDS